MGQTSTIDTDSSSFFALNNSHWEVNNVENEEKKILFVQIYYICGVKFVYQIFNHNFVFNPNRQTLWETHVCFKIVGSVISP